MQSSLWKVAVIAGVVALCLLVINHAREDMADRAEQKQIADQSEVIDAGLGEESNEFSEASLEGHDTDLDGEYSHQQIEIEPYAALENPDPFGEFNETPAGSDEGPPTIVEITEPVEAENTEFNDRAVEPLDNSAPELLSDLKTLDEPALDAVVPEEEEFVDDAPARAVGLFDAAEEAEEQDSAASDSADPFAAESEPSVTATDDLEEIPDLADTEPLPLGDGPEITLDTSLALPTDDGDLIDDSAEAEPVELLAPAPEMEEANTQEDTNGPLSDEGAVDLVLEPEEVGAAPLLLLEENETELEAPDVLRVPVEGPEFDVDLQEEDTEPVLVEPDSLMEEQPTPSDAGPAQDDPFADTGDNITPLDLNEDSEPADEEPIKLPLPPAEEEMPAEEEGLTEDVPVDETPVEEVEAEVSEPSFLDEEPSLFNEEPLPLKDEPAEPTPLIVEPEPVATETEVADEAAERDEATQEAPVEKPEPQPAENSEPPTEPVEQDDVFGEGTVDDDSPRGLQQPQLTIKKLSPPEAVLGKPFIYSIIVKNTGQTRAGKVVVEDEVPRGAKLTGTIPQAELAGTRLIWKLGTLNPGQERKISIRVIPVAEGAIGSVATVKFVAEAAAQTVVKRAKLQLKIKAPQQATKGQPVVFQFQVSNVGTADAKQVVVRNILPTELRHPGGNDLEFTVGDLLMGQSRDIQLTLTAAELGSAVNHAILTAAGDISVTADATVEIIDGGVLITRSGPKKRLLKRPASFTNSIKNKAKTPIKDVVVVENIPEGMRFVKASPGGNFDPHNRTVTWRIQQISGQESQDVSVMLLPETIGEKQSDIRVFGENGPLGEITAATKVRGYSRLKVEISHGERPAELGERISYRIRISNCGTEQASGVLASVLLPEEMKLVSAKGPVEYKQTGRQLDFSAVEKVAPQEQVTIDLLLEAQQAGDARLQVQIQSDQMTKPFNRETATLIFADQ